MTAYPRVADSISGKFGTVVEADAERISVQWNDGGRITDYTAAEVASGRFTFVYETAR